MLRKMAIHYAAFGTYRYIIRYDDIHIPLPYFLRCHGFRRALPLTLRTP